ncbi:armadillo-type protein [Pavlovales sp. CCMP2436]|nr:armadillo-type protein [Pavlovales sp. CCMP2436]
MSDLDIERIPALEAASNGAYDLDENLMLLKLYQFFPEKANAPVIARVLAKALMQLPGNDFLLYMYLIPERVATEAPVLPVVELSARLESCQFQAFWADLVTSRELVSCAPGFDDAIRKYILGIVALTYQIIDLKYLGEILNVSEASALDKYTNQIGKREGDKVRVTLSDDNQAKVKELDDVSDSRTNDLAKAIRAMNRVI